MGLGIFEKLVLDHMVSGSPVPGEEVGIRIDQTLTQDATGTMVYLQFEAMGIPRVRTKFSISYVDHNTLQLGFESSDDHLFLRTFAAKYGIYFSRPGNGICHQVHMERFAVPGESLLGSDSHTPTAGGMGMLAIGAGGLDVALAMAGKPYYFVYPRVIKVELNGTLSPWVSAKDVGLHLLGLLKVGGNAGKALEYGGPGVLSLSVPERATIANMGTEIGVLTSVFPSDERTLEFMRMEGREGMWRPIVADSDAVYEDVIDIDLSAIPPLVACPHSPDNVVPVSEVEGLEVDQVVVGSCTNSSYLDLMKVASLLKGRKVNPNVEFLIAPGSRQVVRMLIENGALADLIDAGARILEPACGPCIGMGHVPPWEGVSIRTFNRNFEGRSGTPNAKVFLTSPEVAAVAAIFGKIVDPRRLGDPPKVEIPSSFPVDDSMIIPPSEDPDSIEVLRGPNIAPIPIPDPLPPSIKAFVLIKLGDDITTDSILPAGPEVLPLRSNIPRISDFTFSRIDPSFPRRAKEAGGGIVVGGLNYGQGSSREHAAMVLMYLGVRAVIAKSFARIHKNNLVNFGILPLVFKNEEDYRKVDEGDEVEIPDLVGSLKKGELVLKDLSKGLEITLKADITERQMEILLAGGALRYAGREV
jgi:aconitate hydratase